MLVHVVRIDNCFDFEGAGKSVVFKQSNWTSCFVLFLIYFQPTGENGATRAPISIDLQRDCSLSSKLYKEWTLVGALTASGQGSYFQDPK
ncbi:hypothetical protein FEM48_Zijuj09G0113200 [Ziziphus jujuba var. spinosa]|uniref:Uncharacterized protein n=1 Tax=Ziziphus jujuba var. spinosa TaxID=714518 RepID=A0A978USQ1_ZIZJJ|nr:hypothetical protein FEM48_Zijuj09G0113200 [Ziziphus jujuba var. spinosa]